MMRFSSVRYLYHSRSINSAVFGLNVLIDESSVVVYKYQLYPWELHNSVQNSDKCRCKQVWVRACGGRSGIELLMLMLSVCLSLILSYRARQGCSFETGGDWVSRAQEIAVGADTEIGLTSNNLLQRQCWNKVSAAGDGCASESQANIFRCRPGGFSN